jgi:hypothetical protein
MGDDAVIGVPSWVKDPAAFVRVLTETAKDLGLEPKFQYIPFGELGVNFLKRNFTREVWHGNPTSCTNIVDVCAKAHMGHGLITDENQKRAIMAAKARAYLITDGNTPLVGDYFRKHIQDEVDESQLSWMQVHPSIVQWPNEPHSDFVEIVNKHLGDAHLWYSYSEGKVISQDFDPYDMDIDKVYVVEREFDNCIGQILLS